MDKSAIRNFAIEARKMLMKSAETEAGFYGVTKNGCKSPIQKGNDFEVYETIAGTENRIYGADIMRRANLVKAVETLGFEQVIEETAYTWFNRIIAIRFMEVNDYLPTRVRVLSSETGSNTPDIVTQSLDVDLNMTPEELEKVQKAKDENRYDDAFRMLFIKQCNELNAILPGLFEKTDDYMELLLKLSYTSDGVVRMLVDSIDENNFNVETEGQVEIIGWMYQFYISEKHEEVIDPIHGKIIKKEDIPAATQLFTTDWVVRYIVDNSLGKFWIERNPQSILRDELKYYIPDLTIKAIKQNVSPEELKIFDPCMGSAHFMIYAFEVIMKIYLECGYSERDAARLIVENNIYGLDIDERAGQLAYFAVMMKARQYDRRILSRGISPHMYSIKDSSYIDSNIIEYFANGDIRLKQIINTICVKFSNAKEYGSLIQLPEVDFSLLKNRMEEIYEDINFLKDPTVKYLFPIIHIAEILSNKYHVVITNPPYMNKYDDTLKKFVTDNFKDYFTDLFSVFMYRNFDFCIQGGYSGMMTPNVWMFIKSHERLRNYILDTKSISSLVQMAKGAFFKEATVDVCAFVLCNEHRTTNGSYIRLEKFKGDMDAQNEGMLKFLANVSECDYYFVTDSDAFNKIPGRPIAYWVSDKMLEAFESGDNFAGNTKKGVLTGNNDKFTRFWHEIDYGKFGLNLYSHADMLNSGKKWFPVTSGGLKRKWYGNFDTVVDLENDGEGIKTTVKNYRLRDPQFYMREAITWTEVSSGILTCRYVPRGILFGNGGPVSFFDNDLLYYHLGLLNSNTTLAVMEYLAPTVNFGPEQISKIPLIKDDVENISKLVNENITLTKSEWDSYEVSWEFKRHPLISGKNLISEAFEEWSKLCDENYKIIKENEEKINRRFIEIYGLEDELEESVEDKNITYRKADKTRDIKSLISYAVGCIFGRYSLDTEGLVCAGKGFSMNDYQSFKPVQENVIPISDENYFSDDIVSLFIEFLKFVYGERYLEENLEFIASGLGTTGDTSREKIRSYFVSGFFSDHLKIYQKKPIYWLLDSGKENGFKALIYMHRYSKELLSIVRANYLNKFQEVLELSLENMDHIINSSSSAVEKANAMKKKSKYIKQLNEIKLYYQALSHLALQKIEIELDDGVKHNYQLFQGIEVIADGGKKQKVDLLAKI